MFIIKLLILFSRCSFLLPEDPPNARLMCADSDVHAGECELIL